MCVPFFVFFLLCVDKSMSEDKYERGYTFMVLRCEVDGEDV